MKSISLVEKDVNDVLSSDFISQLQIKDNQPFKECYLQFSNNEHKFNSFLLVVDPGVVN